MQKIQDGGDFSVTANTVNELIDSVESILPPTGFNTPAPLTNIVVTRQGRQFDCNIRPEDLMDFSLFTNVQYVDINRPDSSGDGTSWATAEKGIEAAIDNAIASALPTMILVNGGEYFRQYSVNSAGPSKSLTAPIALMAVNGRVTTGPFDILSWSKTGGQTNVYQATRSASCYAVDPSITDINGDYKEYLKATSVADCDANAGSWYTDGTTTYVHHSYSLPVNNNNARIYLNAANAWFEGNEDVYIYGFDFEGGSQGACRFNGGNTNVISCKESTFKYAVNGTFSSQVAMDGFRATAAGLYAMYNCDASRNSKDGFNYHQEGGVIPSVLQVNCKGFNNGQIVKTSQSNNGLTTHDGIVAIDIGGEWLGSVGTNSGHIDDGQVWSVGCKAGNSEGDTYNGGGIYWGAFGFWSGTGEMWLDRCEDVGSRIGVYNQAGSTVYIRNHIGTGSRINTSSY